MFNYQKFWKLLESRNISQYSMIKNHIISGSSLSALRNNEYITLALVDRLCKALNCSPEDLIEFTNDCSETTDKTEIYPHD